MNAARIQLEADARRSRQDSALESKTRKGLHFTPPAQREVATLVDWIADHPARKNSRALRAALEAYYDACGV